MNWVVVRSLKMIITISSAMFCLIALSTNNARAFDQSLLKEISVTNVVSENVTYIHIVFNSSDSSEYSIFDEIDHMELHISDEEMYTITEENFETTASSESCLIELPYLLGEEKPHVVLYDVDGGEFNLLDQDARRSRRASTLYDGVWSGTKVDFTVKDNYIPSLTITIYYDFGFCYGHTVRTIPSISISENYFSSSSVSGTFTSASTSSGTYGFFTYTCNANRYFSGSWSSTKETPAPSISISPTEFPVEEGSSIIDDFDSPSSSPGGLAFDGAYFWNADYGSDTIYKLDTAGNVVSSFSSPSTNPTGLAFDGTYLWSADSTTDTIYQLDASGNVVSSFGSPYYSPTGLAFDGTYLWNADSGSDKIYKLDTTGNVVSSFDSPSTSPHGLTFDGSNLWNADYSSDRIYELDTTGNVIRSFDSPDSYPTGLASDGTYLWNADYYRERIYRILPAAPFLVGETASQQFEITNDGFANLNVGAIQVAGTDAAMFSIQNDACSNRSFAPSATCLLSVVFSPTSAGDKTAALEIPSNDPDTPTLSAPLIRTANQWYTVTITANAGGVVSPSTSKSVLYGKDLRVTITPDANYAAEVVVDGVPAGNVSEYTFQNVDSAHTINVTFSKLTPSARTGPVTGLSADSAVLNGWVNPNGDVSTYFFEYGETSAYGNSSSIEDAGAGSTELAVSVNAALSSDSTLHYRIVAVNSHGLENGEDKVFSTAFAYISPDGSCAGKSPCYSTIQGGANGVTVDYANILIENGTYFDDVVISNNEHMIFSGGWDSMFASDGSTATVIDGSLTIGNGGIVVRKLTIQ